MKPIYVATVDEVPTLSLEPHEICHPEPLTSEEIVAMWDSLKSEYERVKRELNKPRVWTRPAVEEGFPV